MMKLTRLLYGQNPDPRLFDYYERLLYNVRYGTQDRNGMLMYYVSLKPGLYKTFGTQFDAFWCCTGTGSEEYAKLNDSIYFHDADSVYVNLFLPSRLTWKERGLTLKQETKFPEEERMTFTVEKALLQPTALKIRVPYWATHGVKVSINGAQQQIVSTPSTYMVLRQLWKSGDVIEVEMPLTLHINRAPDDPKVQAAMFGPLVLAVRQGTEGLTTSMIYASNGPQKGDEGYPMPSVHLRTEGGASISTADEVWFEQVEGSREYPLQFRTKGHGPIHTLVPLNRIQDERYSVYVRNETIT